MSKEEARFKMKILEKNLEMHHYHYFHNDAPIISDAEYDSLKKEYDLLCVENPELPQNFHSKVGYTAKKDFIKGKHNVPMLSLDNAFSGEDMKTFIKKIQNFLKKDDEIDFIAETKVDGLSLSITYHNGDLKRALTRGDGFIGEDVTQNIKNMRTIPKNIDHQNGTLEVRGEIYIAKSDFIALNDEQEKLGLKKFANPRNAAAGSLRQLDVSVSHARPLQFFAYNVAEGLPDTWSVHNKMYVCGFKNLAL